MNIPELLAPAGTLSKMKVAFDFGADAVYAGAAGFSMRPDGAALDIEGLKQAVELKDKYGKKLYIALNIMAFNEEMNDIANWLDQVRDIGIDAMIIGDTGVFDLVREHCPNMPIHISTQMGVANWQSAKFWKKLGASRVVLARECDLEMTKEIAEKSGAEIEVFVHGAMCVAVSGRCLLSAYMSGRSGSRGKCSHSCRWNYKLVEEKRPGEYIPIVETGRETILMGSRDLCLIEHLPQLIESGACSLKIEGRMKSEYYVATVVRAYRVALDQYAADPENYQFDPRLLDELYAVSHRKFSTGFAFGYPSNKPEELQGENQYMTTHQYCGYVLDNGNVFSKDPFRAGDELEWIAPGGKAGTIIIKKTSSTDGTEWDLARPENEVVVEYKGDQFPPASILRRRVEPSS